MRLAYPHTVFHIADKLSHLESLICRAQQLELGRQWPLRLAAGRRGHVHGLYVRVARAATSVCQSQRIEHFEGLRGPSCCCRLASAGRDSHGMRQRCVGCCEDFPSFPTPLPATASSLPGHGVTGSTANPYRKRGGLASNSIRAERTAPTPHHTHTNPTPPIIRLPFVVPRSERGRLCEAVVA